MNLITETRVYIVIEFWTDRYGNEYVHCERGFHSLSAAEDWMREMAIKNLNANLEFPQKITKYSIKRIYIE